MLTTPEGHGLIVVGNAVGFVFALVAASLSVISFPLLLDRNVGVGAAILTSLRVVAMNPVTMAAWFLIVAGALFIGALPLLVGMAVVLPVLGHSTWHLYRRAIEPDSGPGPNIIRVLSAYAMARNSRLALLRTIQRPERR